MNKDKFSGGLGFVLAAVGSAVGLGNIWRFPYLAAKYGGGMFLLVYIILVVTFGFSLMIAENAIGRRTGKGALEAFGALNGKFAFIGALAFVIPCVILPYYNVIGGWVLRFLAAYLFGAHTEMAGDDYFSDMMSRPGIMIIYQFVFTAAATAVITAGVKNGIETLSKLIMPILILFAVVIAVYSVTLPGAAVGVKYFLVPDIGNFSLTSVIGALGQMFFSMSLAMGTMITYGSYIPKDSNLERSAVNIEIFDTAIALLAGLMIIPAVFAFSNGDPTALQAGPTLMFVILPKVFESMGMASVIGAMFFALVLFAALTSSISMMEAVVSSVCEKIGCERRLAAPICGLLAFIAGLLPVFGYNLLSQVKLIGLNILDFMDFLTNSVLMPSLALLTCVFVGWVIGVRTIDDEVESSGEFTRKRLFHVMIRYAGPVLAAVILVSSILNGVGILEL